MKDKVFDNKPIETCYGCQACVQICAQNAIIMKPNLEGFTYPQIDTSKCVDCGLCKKVCPTQIESTNSIFNATPKDVYALWNKHLSERLESTSGGAFFLLANKLLDEDGVVYGVDYNEDLTAYHRRIANKNELSRLRGSKYMQSDINTTYKQAKCDLQSGKKVLFSGTPCQIAGLKLFLRKTYDNLITIDLVCHGTPSPKIFKEHKQYIENKYGDRLIDFKFRAKEKSGWRSYAKYIFKNSKSVHFFLGGDYYCHAFHSGYLNRESCFTCQFSKSQRVGDITLSDFWNGEKYSKELKRQRKHGFNLVMCNTPAGQELVNSISDKAERRTFPVEYAIQGDVRLRHSESRPPFRSEAYKICEEKGYNYLVDRYGYKPSFFQKIIPTWIKNAVREIQSRL